MAIFPLEIFQLIIESFPIHRTKITDTRLIENEFGTTLVNCCLVCKDFVPLCRRELFHHVEISTHRGMSVSHKRLVKVLEKNPYISAYIKSVHYVLHSGWEEALIRRDGRELEDHPPVYDSAYACLFPNIRHLQISHELVRSCHPVPLPCIEPECHEISTLILRHFSHYISITCLTFLGISVSLQDALVLQSVCSLDSYACIWRGTFVPPKNQTQAHHFLLRDLCISDTQNFPVQVIQYCPDLQSIDYIKPDCFPFSYDPSFLGDTVEWNKVTVYKHLRAMSFGETFGISQLCNAAEGIGELAFPALDSLQICYEGDTEDDDEDLYKIIRHAPNVKSLGLSRRIAWRYVDYPGLQLDRCLTSSLTDFSLEYNERDHDISFLSSLLHALSHIKEDNSLKYLNIMASVEECMIDDWKEASLPHWRALDEALAGAGRSDFPNLQQVDIVIRNVWLGNSYVVNTSVQDSVKDFWSGALPSFHEFHVPSFVWERGIARLTFSNPTLEAHDADDGLGSLAFLDDQGPEGVVS
ncbi:hypothetical protein BJ165DRAFT_1513161 [Panaeolus papilionaceus]|nr:hypothetical protein BJ165DRAFT_1513161 [Panaeolus papilionaceus]